MFKLSKYVSIIYVNKVIKEQYLNKICQSCNFVIVAWRLLTQRKSPTELYRWDLFSGVENVCISKNLFCKIYF